ncbi:MAG: FecR domain-containing protein [Acidobacteriaceae bacterium]|nr:FecR domain-containing protein [Acidobacteriaceae bacterium]
MKRVWPVAAKALAGFFVSALCAMPQGYTISARPGALNYIEGYVFINGAPVSDKGLRSVFLSVNDTLSTGAGKAEVLLSPGVFLRIGDNSAIKMISPSLTDAQVEVTRGEAMIEAPGLLKDSDVTILDHQGTVKISKEGLYRISADAPPTAAVLEGKAEVFFGNDKVDLSKGHETTIGPALKAQKFDPKKGDDLYAWSVVRSEYDAASSYQASRNINLLGNGGWWDYGYSGFYSPGWFWNNGFDSWAWLPAYGAFYSPFGWGFYAPGVVGYAPVVYAPVYGGGGGGGTWWKNHPKPGTPVPVNPKRPPAVGAVASSPAAYAMARSQAARSFQNTGYSTASGGHVSASHAASSFNGGSGSRASSGGFSGSSAHASSGGSSGGGGHAGGGGSGAGGGGSHR